MDDTMLIPLLPTLAVLALMYLARVEEDSLVPVHHEVEFLLCAACTVLWVIYFVWLRK